MRRFRAGFGVAALFLFVFFSAGQARGVEISERWVKGLWNAEWCSHPDGPGHDAALFLFRKKITLEKAPSRFVVHVSADQRYQLYVNGGRVATGPARGDLLHWRFESVDIAGHLKAGENVIAAKVWSAGIMAPWAQLTAFTAFILQGDTEAEEQLNTRQGWKVYRDLSWSPMPRLGVRPANHVTGPNEKIDASLHPWGWMDTSFDDSAWKQPVVTGDGVASGILGDGSSLWKLVPRSIPLMEEKVERFAKVVRAKKVKPSPEFVEGKSPLLIPANTTAVVLFDRSGLTNGYPELKVTGGAGSKIRLSYEESLFKYPEVEMGRLIKLNRNKVEKCEIRTDYKLDEFYPDGGAGRILSPLWWRTFRYLQMDVRTGDKPLTIDDFRIIATGYPFEMKADFDSSDPQLRTIWETGWRTARLCAAETYFDCPYYEQLQYGGDTRVQMMISYYMSGDDRLPRNGIELMADSRMTEGITQSRYPSRMSQVIPTFSLAWIGMIADHMMMVGDLSFAEKHIWGMRETLAWFEKHRAANGLSGGLPWWNFVDWSWPGGVPPGASSNGSSIISLQFAIALRQTADIERALGQKAEADRHEQLAAEIVKAVTALCWDATKGLLADSPDKKTYSQHATALGVLSGAIPEKFWRSALEKAVSDPSLTQCTLYYRYFLHRAIEKAGMGDSYISLLGPWRDMLAMGLTTWPETPGETRSDCHAWSSAPTMDLLSIVCGVRPGATGFKSVVIEPHLGNLDWVSCTVPHAKGLIKVRVDKKGNRIESQIELPEGLKGELRQNDVKTQLKAGKQKI